MLNNPLKNIYRKKHFYKVTWTRSEKLLAETPWLKPGTQAFCMVGYREPSSTEARDFIGNAMYDRLYDQVIAVKEISKEEALRDFNMEDWRYRKAFGRDDIPELKASLGHLKAVDIQWDVDEMEDLSLLPSEINIPEGLSREEEISDYLSDVTGFCHKGFSLVEQEMNNGKELQSGQEQEHGWTAEMIQEVEKLHNNTPDGVIHDADTILVDLIEQCDYEFTGLAQDIFNIWKNSTDKKAVEQMFYEFTDMEFDRYLMKCQEEITRGSKEQEQMPEMNTKMEYLYCDADNYKKLNVCVIKGQITDGQKAAIMDCLHDGEFFIPNQVGLPEERFDDGPTEADHCWFTLEKEGFEETTLEPTVDLSAEELVTAFQSAKGRWDDGVSFEEPGAMLLSFEQAKGDTLAAAGREKSSLPEQIQLAAARTTKTPPGHPGKVKDTEPFI